MSTGPTRLTPEEYLEIERKGNVRHEYYSGEIFAMSGASREHTRLVGRLALLTGAHVEGRGCEFYVPDMRVLVEANDLYTYPDFAVSCAPRFTDDAVDTLLNPVLLVEVLSPSTERYDRIFKANAYRSIASLRELLRISQDTAQVEHYQRQDESRWSHTTVAGVDASIHLESIDFTLRLADLYRGILPAEADSAAG